MPEAWRRMTTDVLVPGGIESCITTLTTSGSVRTGTVAANQSAGAHITQLRPSEDGRTDDQPVAQLGGSGH
jgi:hypothetical protein